MTIKIDKSKLELILDEDHLVICQFRIVIGEEMPGDKKYVQQWLPEEFDYRDESVDEMLALEDRVMERVTQLRLIREKLQSGEIGINNVTSDVVSDWQTVYDAQLDEMAVDVYRHVKVRLRLAKALPFLSVGTTRKITNAIIALQNTLGLDK